jgi:hypothetical protein
MEWSERRFSCAEPSVSPGRRKSLAPPEGPPSGAGGVAGSSTWLTFVPFRGLQISSTWSVMIVNHIDAVPVPLPAGARRAVSSSVMRGPDEWPWLSADEPGPAQIARARRGRGRAGLVARRRAIARGIVTRMSGRPETTKHRDCRPRAGTPNTAVLPGANLSTLPTLRGSVRPQRSPLAPPERLTTRPSPSGARPGSVPPRPPHAVAAVAADHTLPASPPARPH